MGPKRLGNALMDYTTADVLNTPIRRGGILPVTEYADRSEVDMTSGLPGAFWNALMAPARAYRGELSEGQQIPEAFNFAGSLTLGSLLAPRPAGSVGMGGRAGKALEAQQPQGIKAFHGSPHDFDRFDMSKIGTGEGAQAYGHGLYFAEAEDVARSYRDGLSRSFDRPLSLSFEGKRIIGDKSPLELSPDELAARYVAYQDGDATKTIGQLEGLYNKPELMPDWQRQAINRLKENPGRFDGVKFDDPGHMYEVRINADPADFLDWDKPFLGQSNAVQSAMREAGQHPERSGPFGTHEISDMPVGTMLARQLSDKDHLLYETMREAGIPGIRYLDQMSRGAGEGSSNYVVFDDKLIEIMRKYGLLGPVAAGTVAAATNDEGPIY